MHWTLRARRERGERGASAVEFALVMPILLMVLFGLISTGMTFSDHLSATNAVREGSRYGAAANLSPTWAASVKDRVKQVYFNAGASAPTDDQICVRLVQAGGGTAAESIGASCGTAPATPTNMAVGSCAVLVWMQRPSTIKLIVLPDLTLNIGADSVAYYSRQVTSTCPAA